MKNIAATAAIALVLVTSFAGCLGSGSSKFPSTPEVFGTAEKLSFKPEGGVLTFRKTGVLVELEKGDVKSSGEALLVTYGPSGYSGTTLKSDLSPLSDYYQFDGLELAPGKTARVTLPFNEVTTVSSAEQAILSLKPVASLGTMTDEQLIARIEVYAMDKGSSTWVAVTNGKSVDSKNRKISILAEKLYKLVVGYKSDGSSGTVTASSIFD